MNNFDVIVIGAGAAGLIAAGRAAEEGANVCLLEKKSRPAIKLSITGKGRCNITNDAEPKEFIKEFGTNGKFLFSAFGRFFSGELLSFFKKYGVDFKLERGGRYFPRSDDAHSVVNALIKYAKDNKVKIRTSAGVRKITKNGRSAESVTLENGEILKAKKYVIATGGLSYPQTGSTGDGYKFAAELGHTVTELSAALVPLVLDSPFLKQLNGLKLKNAEFSFFANGKPVTNLFGEAEFTSFGITGPVILTASSVICPLLKKNETAELSINLKPALDDNTLDQRLVRELDSFGSLPVRQMLKELLPIQMTEPFMKINGIKHTKKCSQVSKNERKTIFEGLRKMNFKIKSARPVGEAIVTRGGVALKEIEQKSMRSKLIDNLYFCGEILDLDGPTGGFNLQAAFSTGYIAGSNTEVQKFSSLDA